MNIKRVIIKIGSSSIISNGVLNKALLIDLAKEISVFRNQGIKPLIVTSGAVAVGSSKLNIKQKNKPIPLKQACAALGQGLLMKSYEEIFDMYNIPVAQILLSHDDFDDRKRMINLSNTIETLLEYNVLPILNENDAVSIEEIKVGDNDSLASLVIPLAKADLLVIISDVDGLYSCDPNVNENATVIKEVEEINSSIWELAGGVTSSVGTGGMRTKIKAAQIASDFGCDMMLIGNKKIDKLSEILNGENLGTIFRANDRVLSSRELWMIYNAHARGSIVVDDGAKKAIMESRKSLLPKGIIGAYGDYLQGCVVSIVDKDNNIIAKGITNYSSTEIKEIKGMTTDEIKKLGFTNKKEVVHANDLVLIMEERYGRFR